MNEARMVKDGETLIERIELASSFRDRAIGLIGRDSLGAGKGLHIAQCGCVHTFLMSFSLDLVFLDKDLKVVRVLKGVRPNRVAAGGIRAASVVELESGWFAHELLTIGDVVALAEAV